MARVTKGRRTMFAAHTLRNSQWRRKREKRCFLSIFLKVDNVGAERISNRRLSQSMLLILTGPRSVWFGLVRKRSDFDSSGSVNSKRVYGSVCDESEPSSWAGSVRFNMANVHIRK